MSTERTPLSDKELWQSLAAARADRACGRVGHGFRRLAGRPAVRRRRRPASRRPWRPIPEMRQAALELADILGRPLPAPPPRMAVRAKALVGFEAEQRTQARQACSTGCSPVTGALPCSAARGAAPPLVVAADRLHAGRRPRRIGGRGALCPEHAAHEPSAGHNQRIERSCSPTASDMSSRLTQVLLALSLLLNTFVLAGFVYRSWIAAAAVRAVPTPPPPGQRGPSALEAVTHDLNLDDGQRQALQRCVRAVRHDPARAVARDPEAARRDVGRATEAADHRHGA